MTLSPLATAARDGPAIWDSRCEECHGAPAPFATKYLWNVEGRLQGQHHIDNMPQFLSNHYVPAHEIVPIREMLLAQANTPARFATECGECHGEINAFVANSLWVGKSSISGMQSGMEAGEFLGTHREIKTADVIFYLKLFYRISGKSTPSELINPDPGIQFR